ncbi:MAG: dockerin type I domain-containing protein [Ruminococcus sp.]|nr:dockerin type I domain-containing protein [Ruminococcus sp.]
MKKNKFCSLVYLGLIFSFAFINNVNAKEHGLELETVLCPVSNYEGLQDYEAEGACAEAYLNGTFNDYILNKDSNINAGDIVMVVEKYNYGSTSEIFSISAKIRYDDSTWQPLYYEDSLLYYDNSDNFPMKNKFYKWSNGSRNDESGWITNYLRNNSGMVFNEDVVLNIYFLTAKKDLKLIDSPILFNYEDCDMIKSGIDILEHADFAINDLSTSLNNLFSFEYEIDKNGDFPIVTVKEPKTRLYDFIYNFINDYNSIEIYDKNDNIITDYRKFVGSNMKIVLKNNNEIIDELTIIVKGDYDGDGNVSAFDLISIDNVILRIFELSFTSINIFDIDKDGRVSAVDQSWLTDYFIRVAKDLKNY